MAAETEEYVQKGACSMIPATKQEARALGLKFYCTGNTCKYGHTTNRYASTGHCVLCNKIHQVEWGKTNRDRKNELHRRWMAAHPGIKRTYKKTPDNPETKKRWSKANPEKMRAYGRSYYQRNREHFRAKVRNRYARQAAAKGRHTAADIQQILKAQRGCCAYCREKLGKKRHVDHILALANGGSNDPANLQILCGPCNLSKGTKHPLHFARELGMLL
mgnify:CR=1 FL=1